MQDLGVSPMDFVDKKNNLIKQLFVKVQGLLGGKCNLTTRSKQ